MQRSDDLSVSLCLPAYNRRLFAGVWRVAEEALEVRVHYLDTWAERAVVMLVGARDFRVRSAELIGHRDQEGRPGGREGLPELEGLTAYPGSGSEFRRALGVRPRAEHWLELFLEGVKAVLQAEFCVAGERGFASEEEYERYFADRFARSCIYYSRPLSELRPWGVYVADQVRDGCLFLRLRTASLAEVPGRGQVVSAVLTDSFHELALTLEVGPSGKVAAAETASIRVPDPVCRLAGGSVRRLLGLRAADIGRAELAGLLAGPEGCSHLVDVAADAVSLIRAVALAAGTDTQAAERGAGV